MAILYNISRNGATVHLIVDTENVEKTGLCGGIREMEPTLDAVDLKICQSCPWYDSTADYFLDCKLYTPNISSAAGDSNGVTREPDSYRQAWIDMNKEKFEEAKERFEEAKDD